MYAGHVSVFTQTLELTAAVPQGAVLQISGQEVASGSEWTSPLDVGVNEFSIVVMDRGAPVRSYQLIVTRGDPVVLLKAANADAGDGFGYATALSADGETLAVGAWGEASAAAGVGTGQDDDDAPNAGAVYVFTMNAGTWSQQAYIKASNTGESDLFGTSVGLSADGNTLAVGAPSEDGAGTGIGSSQSSEGAENAGAVYVFTRNNHNWSQQAYVKASNAGEGDEFGFALALSADGNTLAVGANGEDSAGQGIGPNFGGDDALDSGAAYVFVRSEGTWTEQAYVKASNTGAGDAFGTALALSADGNTLAVGSYGEDGAASSVSVAGASEGNDAAPDSGAAYVFVRSSAVWSQQAYVKASNPGEGDIFGISVALSGDGNTLAIGAFEDSSVAGTVSSQSLPEDDSAPDAGATYVFTRDGTEWSQQAYVKPSNPGEGDRFGSALGLSDDGNTLAVGAPFEGSASTGLDGAQEDAETGARSGAVYWFTRNSVGWTQTHYLKAINSGRGDNFGYHVTVSSDGETLVVGAPLESSILGNPNDNSAMNAGATYLYH
jgi:hypothetical protein